MLFACFAKPNFIFGAAPTLATEPGSPKRQVADLKYADYMDNARVLIKLLKEDTSKPEHCGEQMGELVMVNTEYMTSRGVAMVEAGRYPDMGPLADFDGTFFAPDLLRKFGVRMTALANRASSNSGTNSNGGGGSNGDGGDGLDADTKVLKIDHLAHQELYKDGLAMGLDKPQLGRIPFEESATIRMFITAVPCQPFKHDPARLDLTYEKHVAVPHRFQGNLWYDFVHPSGRNAKGALEVTPKDLSGVTKAIDTRAPTARAYQSKKFTAAAVQYMAGIATSAHRSCQDAAAYAAEHLNSKKAALYLKAAYRCVVATVHHKKADIAIDVCPFMVEEVCDDLQALSSSFDAFKTAVESRLALLETPKSSSYGHSGRFNGHGGGQGGYRGGRGGGRGGYSGRGGRQRDSSMGEAQNADKAAKKLKTNTGKTAGSD